MPRSPIKISSLNRVLVDGDYVGYLIGSDYRGWDYAPRNGAASVGPYKTAAEAAEALVGRDV